MLQSPRLDRYVIRDLQRSSRMRHGHADYLRVHVSNVYPVSEDAHQRERERTVCAIRRGARVDLSYVACS